MSLFMRQIERFYLPTSPAVLPGADSAKPSKERNSTTAAVANSRLLNRHTKHETDMSVGDIFTLTSPGCMERLSKHTGPNQGTPPVRRLRDNLMMRLYAFFFEAWHHGAQSWQLAETADAIRGPSGLLVLLSIFFVSFTSLLRLACWQGKQCWAAPDKTAFLSFCMRSMIPRPMTPKMKPRATSMYNCMPHAQHCYGSEDQKSVGAPCCQSRREQGAPCQHKGFPDHQSALKGSAQLGPAASALRGSSAIERGDERLSPTRPAFRDCWLWL